MNAMQKAAGLSVGPSTDKTSAAHVVAAVGNETWQPVEALEDLRAWELKPAESTTVVVLGISRPVPPKNGTFAGTQYGAMGLSQL